MKGIAQIYGLIITDVLHDPTYFAGTNYFMIQLSQKITNKPALIVFYYGVILSFINYLYLV